MALRDTSRRPVDPMVTGTFSSDTLARLPLVLAAVSRGAVIADERFPPGTTVTVGSNSGNSLVIPERFELTSYTLIRDGHLLELAPPLYVQATVWVGDQSRELKGYYRDLRKAEPELPSRLALAGDRFVISYATGLVLLGRFVVDG